MTAAPLRVGVNLLWLVPGVVGGSEEYTTRLLAGVAGAGPPDIALTLFVLPSFVDAYPHLADAFPTVVAPVRGRAKPLRVAAEGTWLAWMTRRKYDLMHHAGGTMPVVRTAPGVVTIHDLQPLELPAHFSLVKRLYLQLRLGPSARGAGLVLTLSEDTRRAVVHRLRASPDRVVLVPPGIGVEAEDPEPPEGSPAARYGIDGPFFVYPAITYPHKNHAVLIRAFATVVAQRPDAMLVLTGGESSSEADVAALVGELRVGERVRRVGRIPRSDVDWLLRHAVALTFPSRFEGFGIPALEAMAQGCPVVAAAATALPEVVGDAGVLLSPDDPEEWSHTMIDLMDDSDRRATLGRAGRARSERFSWAAATDALLAAYRRAAGRPAP